MPERRLQIRPMKAQGLNFLPDSMELDFRPIKFPVLASPKMDGIRGLVMREGVMSNTLKSIPNGYIQKVLSDKLEALDMDGELIVGSYDDPQAFKTSRGPIMTDSSAPIDFRLVVFDKMDINPSYGYAQRTAWAMKSVSDFQRNYPTLAQHVMYLEHKLLRNLSELLEMEADAVAKGFEGLMLRSPQGPYKFGRATLKEGYLIKVKRFVDMEAQIVGFEELMLNENAPQINDLGLQRRSSHKDGLRPAGTLGAFVLSHPAFTKTFTCGSGLNDSNRQEYWNTKDQLKGRYVKFKYQKHGSTPEAPRTPIFLEIRHPNDM